MAVILNTKFTEYYKEFEDIMTREAAEAVGEIPAVTASAYQDMLNSIKNSFRDFGLTKEQEAEFLMQAHVQAFATVNSNATKAAIGLIAEEKDQDVKDAQIGLTSVEITKIIAETNLTDQKRLTEVQTTLKTIAETDLIEQKELTEIEVTLTQAETTLKVSEEILKITEDIARLTRDIQAYDDQMLMDLVKNQASVVSFAVNSGSTFAQDTIDDLKCMMRQVQAIANPSSVCIPAPA